MMTSLCVSVATVADIWRDQEREEGRDESEDESEDEYEDEPEDEPDVKRVKIANAAETEDGYEAGDELTYEPEPKRRKTLRYTVCHAGAVCDTDDEGDGDGDDDESFVDNEHTSNSEDDYSIIDEDDQSTPNAGTSSTFSPISSPLRHPPCTHNATPLQFAHVAHKRVRRGSITGLDMLQLGREPHLSHSLLPLEPRVKAGRGRRQRARFTIYEDDTATHSGCGDSDLPDDGGMPAIDRRVLTTLDQGQENRQPAYRRVTEGGFEAENALDEEDGHQ